MGEGTDRIGRNVGLVDLVPTLGAVDVPARAIAPNHWQVALGGSACQRGLRHHVRWGALPGQMSWEGSESKKHVEI